MKYIKHIIFGGMLGSIVSLGLLLIAKFPRPLTLILGFLFPLLFLLSFYFYVKKTRSWKEPIGFLTVVLLLSQIGLVSIIEHEWVRFFVIIFSGVVIGILYGGGVTRGDILSALQKPYRRFVMASWVVTVFGITSSMYALELFLPSPILFVVLLLLGGSLMGYVSSFVWSMYFPRPSKAFLLWMVLIGFISMQLLWSFHFLPLGYLALGMFVTWLWYLLVLFARFHWDEQGVEWKKQYPFLLTNLIIFAILIKFFVRWV